MRTQAIKEAKTSSDAQRRIVENDRVINLPEFHVSNKYIYVCNVCNVCMCVGMVCNVCMVWYGMVWYGMVWYGMVWYGM